MSSILVIVKREDAKKYFVFWRNNLIVTFPDFTLDPTFDKGK